MRSENGAFINRQYMYACNPGSLGGDLHFRVLCAICALRGIHYLSLVDISTNISADVLG